MRFTLPNRIYNTDVIDEHDIRAYTISSGGFFSRKTTIEKHSPDGHGTQRVATIKSPVFRRGLIVELRGRRLKGRKFLRRKTLFSRARVFSGQSGASYEWTLHTFSDSHLCVLDGPEVVGVHAHGLGVLTKSGLTFDVNDAVLHDFDEILTSYVYALINARRK